MSTKSTTDGRLIAFEGSGGSGKSTALATVARELESRGYSVLRTKQPGGTQFGARLREILLSPEYAHDVDDMVQIALFSADRWLHVKQVIRPALAAGQIVLSDRWTYSMCAYQGVQGTPHEIINYMSRTFTNNITPDLSIWFDVDPREGMRRRAADRQEPDRFDETGLAFQESLRDEYHAMHALGQIDSRIDANRPAAEVAARALDLVLSRLDRPCGCD